ncbi:HNH endonuclease [Thiorhodococcus drewsii AZ1]|uniref:HNH endonuclease n=1 Tax=Thiorhodococcus drewsii AZ1 TaxID=765913 RepID=G2E2F8_9GAMM|nr:RNA-guided endonuclease IscB [Thiorhodococcus drewsii]EGV30874.1 HNH endonuclease [Thiorhodococcus drewsii AZ1]
MAVFVLDKKKRPLMPCSEKRARLLLKRERAVVVRLAPFTIRLKDRVGGATQPLRIKLDPGSKTTGLALVREEEIVDPETGEVTRTAHVVWLGELTHRGHQIREALTARSAMRRRRRTANLRHRAPRFDNRTKPCGWLAPSLRHRVETTVTWVERLRRLAPITAISQERVRFDMQAMQNPEISGLEYQQGTLAGYEVREYLLEKWRRTCAYCGAKDIPLQIEHIQPKSMGGSNRISNLTLACAPCNQKKGNRPVTVFLANKPDRLKRIQAHVSAPLRDAAAVNATRWALFESLKATGLPVETGSGGCTKFNRMRLGVPKTHALDAACVGQVDALHGWQCPTLAIKATGRGSYQRTRLDRFGFPRGVLMRQKRVHGFQTGDRVIACVPTGKKAGTYVGRVAIRATGSFNIQTAGAVVQGLSYRYCRTLQRADGYGYSFNPTPKEEARQAA